MMGGPMQVVAALALGSVLGIGVGIAFFGGLAWTVSRLPDARAPGRLVMASLVLRLAVAALGAWAAASLGGMTATAALAVAAIGVRTVVVTRMAPGTQRGR